jgi:30S ribosomal protein S31
MGRGDKRTRRGKIFKGSYGNTRLQTTKSTTQSAKSSTKSGTKGVDKAATATKPAPVKKAPVAKKTK